MAEKIRPELTGFLHGSELSLRILVVENLVYLPKLRQMYPRASLFAVAADADRFDAPAYRNLDVTFRAADYLAEPLPFSRGSFDYILSDLTLEQAGNPQDIAAGFSTYLKETGSLLTSFHNIRFWEQIQDLREGHYYQVVARYFAKPEFEKLLYASFYKCVHMRPQRRKAPEGLIEELTEAGFSNRHDDLETEYWLVKADRSMPELSLLKSMFTKEQRAELSRLLHRIEYGVETSKSVQSFWRLYHSIGLFPAYTAAFIHEAVFHPVAFYRNLKRETQPEDADALWKLLDAMQEEETEDEAGENDDERERR